MMLIALLFFKLVFPDEAILLQEKLFIANYYYNTEWKYTFYDNGIGVGERWLIINETLGVRERRGEIVIDCNYQQAIDYLKDVKTIGQWVRKIKDVTPLPNANPTFHLVLRMPWPLSNRDAVVTFKHFRLDNGSSILQLSSTDPTSPEKGKVRIGRYQTTILVTKLDDDHTKIELSTFTDEKPMLPVRIQDPFIRKALYHNLLQLKSRLTQS